MIMDYKIWETPLKITYFKACIQYKLKTSKHTKFVFDAFTHLTFTEGQVLVKHCTGASGNTMEAKTGH